MDRTDNFRNLGIGCAGARKPIYGQVFEAIPSFFAKTVHDLPNTGRISIKNEIKQALEIGSNLNIHGGSQTGRNLSEGVLSRIKKPVQDVVLIGSNTKTPYGNAHLGEQPPGKNITKVSGRHNESRIFTIPGTQTQPSEKIINGLSEDTGQVDRIDCGETDFFPKGKIGE